MRLTPSRRREDRPRRNALRPRRTLLSLEPLESRLVLDRRTFQGLVFDAVQSFREVNGTSMVSGPVRVRLEGANRPDLLQFDGGVSFRASDTTGAFSTAGIVRAIASGQNIPLLSGGVTHTFKAGELRGAGGSRFSATNAANLTVPIGQMVGGTLSVRSIRLAAAEPTVNLGGDFGFLPFPGLAVPLPANVPIFVNPMGTQLGVDIAATASNLAFTKGGLNVKLDTATVAYTRAGNRWELSGSGSLTLPNIAEPLAVQLGTPGQATAGIVVTNNAVTRFQASLSNTNGFTVGGLKITPTNLQVSYRSGTAANPVETVSVDGAATFSIARTSKALQLDFGSTTDTRGIVFENGEFAGLSAIVSAPEVGFGNAVTLRQVAGQIDYSREERTFALTGQATAALEGSSTEVLDVQLGSADAESPGLVIGPGGVVSRFDLTARTSRSFRYRGLTITPDEFRLGYERNPDDKGATVTFSGGASLGFDAAGEVQTMGVSLGDRETPGVVVSIPDAGAASLRRFQATVTASLRLKGLEIDADQLTFSYVQATNSYILDGGVRVSAGGNDGRFAEIKATLGDARGRHGIVVTEGKLDSVYIVVQGGFNLFGLSVQSNDLTIQYDASPGRLRLSGGVTVSLSNTLRFGASIGAGGRGALVIDAAGNLSIDTSQGLSLTGEFAIGGVIEASIAVNYRTNPNGTVSLDASGSVDLPQGLPDVAARFAINGGTLTSISVSTSGVSLGTTGLQITDLNGTVENLDDPSRLKVSGQIGVQSTQRLFGRALIHARGGFTFTPRSMHIDASLKLVDGILGSGSGSIDLDFDSGIYQINVRRIGLFSNLITFTGGIVFDNGGNLTVDASAAVNIPDFIPLIGGYQLASANFYLQVRPGLGPDKNFGAAWISFGFLGDLGVQFPLGSGSPSLITAPPERTPPPSNGFDYFVEIPVSRQGGLDQITAVVTHDIFKPENIGRLDPRSSFIQIFAVKTENPNIGVTQRRFFLSELGGGDLSGTLQRGILQPGELLATANVGGEPLKDLQGIHTIRISLHTNINISTSEFGGAAPKFRLIQSYKPSTVSEPRVEDDFGREVRDDGSVDVQSSFTINAPDINKARISLYYRRFARSGSTTIPVGSGILIRTFSFSDPEDRRFLFVNPDNGAGGLRYNWTGLTELYLSDGREGSAGSVELYTVLEDGIQDPVTSPPSVRITPLNPVPRIEYQPIFNIKEVALGRVGPAGGLAGIRMSDALSVFRSTDAITLLSTTLELLEPTGLAGPVGYLTRNADVASANDRLTTVTDSNLGNVVFVAGPGFLGSTSLRIVARSLDPLTGKTYEVAEVFRIVSENADVRSTVTIANPRPVDGDLVTIEVAVTNAVRVGAVAVNPTVDVALPKNLTDLEWAMPVGTFDTALARWSGFALGVGETRTLRIRGRLRAEFTLRSDLILASVTSTAFDPDRTNNVGQALLVDTNRAMLALGRNLEPGLVGTPLGFAHRLLPDFVQRGSGGPYLFRIVRGALPEGVRLEADGSFVGTPTAPGSFRFTAEISDRLGDRAERDFAWSIASDRVDLGTDYHHVFQVDGGPARFQINPFGFGDRLPEGLVLEGDGQIRGTPTQAGVFQLNVLAILLDEQGNDRTDVGARSALSFLLHVRSNEPATFVAPGSDLIRVGVPGAIQFTATPGATGFFVDPSLLPAGLSLSLDGLLTGTPTQPFDSMVPVVFRTPGGLRMQTIRLRARYDPAPIAEIPQDLPTAGQGQFYRFNLVPSANPDRFQLLPASDLPAGLTLDSAGVLSGRPSAPAGDYVIRVTINDRFNPSATARMVRLRLRINPELVLNARRLLPTGFGGLDYDETLSASGGTGEGYRYRILSGLLPEGLLLSPTTGRISGRILRDSPGTARFTVQVTDSAGVTDQQAFGIEVGSIRVLNRDDEVSIRLTELLGISGNNVATRPGTSLPPGLVLRADGTLSGRPTASGTFAFDLTYDAFDAASSANLIHVKRVQFLVTRAIVSKLPAAIPDRPTPFGRPVSLQIRSTGGRQDRGYSYRIVSGTLPNGLTLSPSGRISGTPNATGRFSYRIQTTDVLGGIGLLDVTQVVFKPVALGASQPTTLVAGSRALGRFAGAEGFGTYRYAIVSGSLPAGVTLDQATGTLLGTPTAPGRSSVLLAVTDQLGRVASGMQTIEVLPAITIRPTSRIVQAGETVEFPIEAAMGTGGPFRFGVVAGSLPGFLTLTRDGRVTGRAPATPSNSRIRLIVTDRLGFEASQSLDLRVNARPVVTGIRGVTRPGQPLTLNPLALAVDPDGDPIRAAAITAAPRKGTAILRDGLLVYTPNAGATGSDRVIVSIQDPVGGSTPQTIDLTIRTSNAAPVAVANQARTPIDTPITLDVLANDSDPDRDPLSLLSITSPAASAGTARIVNNRIVFTPARGFVGNAVVGYVVTDGNLRSTGQVTVEVPSKRLFQVVDGFVSASEESGSARIRLRRASNLNEVLTVRYSIEPASPAATPDPTTDLNLPLSGTVTFPANVQDVALTLPFRSDLIAEPEESFRVRFFPTDAFAAVQGGDTATLRLIDNDPVRLTAIVPESSFLVLSRIRIRFDGPLAPGGIPLFEATTPGRDNQLGTGDDAIATFRAVLQPDGQSILLTPVDGSVPLFLGQAFRLRVAQRGSLLAINRTAIGFGERFVTV